MYILIHAIGIPDFPPHPIPRTAIDPRCTNEVLSGLISYQWGDSESIRSPDATGADAQFFPTLTVCKPDSQALANSAAVPSVVTLPCLTP